MQADCFGILFNHPDADKAKLRVIGGRLPALAGGGLLFQEWNSVGPKFWDRQIAEAENSCGVRGLYWHGLFSFHLSSREVAQCLQRSGVHFIEILKALVSAVGSGIATSMVVKQFVMEISIFVKNPVT